MYPLRGYILVSPGKILTPTSAWHQSLRWAHILSFTCWIWMYFFGRQNEDSRLWTGWCRSWNSILDFEFSISKSQQISQNVESSTLKIVTTPPICESALIVSRCATQSVLPKIYWNSLVYALDFSQMIFSYASSICPDKIFFVQHNFEIVQV